jgi:hypothetical protein
MLQDCWDIRTSARRPLKFVWKLKQSNVLFGHGSLRVVSKKSDKRQEKTGPSAGGKSLKIVTPPGPLG